MENHIRTLSALQQKQGHTVTLLFSEGDKISDSDIRILKKWPYHKIKPQAVSLFAFYIRALVHFAFKPQRFDAIHVHGDWSSLVFIKTLKRLTRAKTVVFSFHGQINYSPAHYKLLPYLLKKVNLIFTTGFESGNLLHKLTGRKINIQPSGIQPHFFEKQQTKDFDRPRFEIITAANLHPVKNIEFILNIAEKLKDMSFKIAGAGPLKQALQSIIDKKQLNNVSLLGFKDTFDIKKLYDNSDCFLLTSFAEGTPTAVLEAMACGLPIIASNAGGLDNIVKDGENGSVLKGFDVDAYLEKIKMLQISKELRMSIFTKNIITAESYRWEVVAKNITDSTIKCLNG
ncbi:glycosyltransferase family 4 protein [Mucilaginibacter polytrichastri]|uniref:glycosyltransferase family 4 protein n=1 Tax=Mucilaginibacter polytrichastri TaxID=1302689 RepID=UPI001C318705|nr:glycosyltransferase family 4 protein [Mucilaginibacter polytrichastri]